jgi:hypothetical protein
LFNRAEETADRNQGADRKDFQMIQPMVPRNVNGPTSPPFAQLLLIPPSVSSSRAEFLVAENLSEANKIVAGVRHGTDADAALSRNCFCDATVFRLGFWHRPDRHAAVAKVWPTFGHHQ